MIPITSYSQVIPLYMQQELLENEDHGGGDEVVKKGHEPHYPLMTPPQEIVAYPPLAFLLNSFLIGLNYLKDCPLISLQSHMTTQLQKYFFDISKFVSEHAEDIKQKGKKYFISSGAHSKKILDETTMMKSQESMDELYFQYLQHILEFVLKCFQLIYSGTV